MVYKKQFGIFQKYIVDNCELHAAQLFVVTKSEFNKPPNRESKRPKAIT